MDVVNEKSGVEFSAHFSDAVDLPTVPVSVHWRLDCETTKQPLIDWTEAETTTVVEEGGVSEVYAVVEVPGSANAIQSPRNWRELKTLLVVAGKDTPREFSKSYQYYVRNLRGRS